MLAREISVEAFLFLMFWSAFFWFFVIFLENILEKIFRKNSIAFVLELCVSAILARVLAYRIEPIAQNFLEKETDLILDVLYNIFIN